MNSIEELAMDGLAFGIKPSRNCAITFPNKQMKYQRISGSAIRYFGGGFWYSKVCGK